MFGEEKKITERESNIKDHGERLAIITNGCNTLLTNLLNMKKKVTNTDNEYLFVICMH